MVLNIVKNNLDIVTIARHVKEVFTASEVCIGKDHGISVDIEVKSLGGLHSLEGLKELEYYFREDDVRIW